MTSFESRFRGGIVGLAIGDALGVPVEFQTRGELKKNPVTDFRAGGRHDQPAGTWSDDTSMSLCLLESLADGQDWNGVARNFARWMNEGHWTPHGKVFDIGVVTREAVGRTGSTADARDAGGNDERSNGNGSLMRTLPVALMMAGRSFDDIAHAAHDQSRITHAHPRSLIACGIYCVLASNLLTGESPADAWDKTRLWASDFYNAAFPGESSNLQDLLMRNSERWKRIDEAEVGSSGYVMHSLEAAIWCLFTARTFKDAVLKAVNLGEDADTTGAVAGGLAGIHHGIERIPEQWIQGIARREDIDRLVEAALGKVLQTR